MAQIDRLLLAPPGSFFLFGPRGVGKSSWVREQLKPDYEIDLLESRVFLELQRNPSSMEARTAHLKPGQRVFIDEIQKLPETLDEVHRLIEKKKLSFILTGSSARKLKRAGANLLGGRAETRRLFPFSLQEIGNPTGAKLDRILEFGTLPPVYRDYARADEFLSSYVETYLREEIKEEALVRRIEEFSRFLEIAGQLHTQTLNIENIGRETGKSGPTIQSWYQILEETLLGYRVFPYRPSFKVREQSHSKFYWFDSGVARAAAGLIRERAETAWSGKALEALVLRELLIYSEISRKQKNVFYYGTPGVGEIDFIVETKKKTTDRPGEFISVEVKFARKWKSEYESASRSLKTFAPKAHQRMLGVYMGDDRLTSNGFEVLPLAVFIDELFAGNLF